MRPRMLGVFRLSVTHVAELLPKVMRLCMLGGVFRGMFRSVLGTFCALCRNVLKFVRGAMLT